MSPYHCLSKRHSLGTSANRITGIFDVTPGYEGTIHSQDAGADPKFRVRAYTVRAYQLIIPTLLSNNCAPTPWTGDGNLQ